jgi:hypothetical protein
VRKIAILGREVASRKELLTIWRSVELAMKGVYEVLRQREVEIVRVRKEIEALHFVIPLLAEEGDRFEYGLPSRPSTLQFPGTGGTTGRKGWP